MADIAAAAGFGSVRRFNSHIRRTYARTPTQIRRLGRHRAETASERYRVRLAYRPPYDWDAILAFLAARATPGVEIVNGLGIVSRADDWWTAWRQFWPMP